MAAAIVVAVEGWLLVLRVHPGSGRHMSFAHVTIVLTALLGGCSPSSSKSAAMGEEPWSRADYFGQVDPWWNSWLESLGGQLPFGVGTEFETETLGLDGVHHTETFEVTAIEPFMKGFKVVLASSTGKSVKAVMPPELLYNQFGDRGFVATRNPKLVSVTVPAGTFDAARLWTAERHEGVDYERDVWLAPGLPIPVQTWSRPVTARELYNPPADGTVPYGTAITRLVRVDKR